jgi:MoCo/4Fe-4S cofactor protein with predicted Tat translocation signal
MKEQKRLDLAAFSDRVERAGQRNFWRSFEELDADPEFKKVMSSEFPYADAEREEPVDRRSFLKLMGASVAFAGLTACRKPAEAIIPYVRKPEEVIPGTPLFFATAMTLGGSAVGVLVESHEGRPTKIEGNPEHPASLGATDAFAQASILGLYDPDRSGTVRNLGEIATWADFTNALQRQLARHRSDGGAGLRILTETIVSPTAGEQIRSIAQKYPQAGWHQFEPVTHDAVREGSRIAFGQIVSPVYQFANADLVVSFDSEFLTDGAAHLRYAREFARKRRVRAGKTSTTRFYAVDAGARLTGASADQKIIVKPSEIEAIVRAVAAGVGVSGAQGAAVPQQHVAFVNALIKDLRAHGGRSVVVCGEEHPAEVQALVHAINGVLGNAGRTVVYLPSPEIAPINQTASLAQLVNDMRAGKVQTLLIMSGNPVFNAPADLQFAKAMEKVPFRAHLSMYYDETSAKCHWHVPEAHYLESWSDTRSFDGTVSIVQPLIAPLYNGKTLHEFLAAVTADNRSGYDIVRTNWSRTAAGNFESFWNKSLHDGVVANTAAQPLTLQANTGAVTAALAARKPVAVSGLEIAFRHDPTIYDGRFGNNGFLHELPKPLTCVTWDNVVHVSLNTARRLGITAEEKVRVKHKGGSVTMPVWITAGHPDETVTVHFGYGRRRVGKVGNKVGADVYPIRTSTAMHFSSGVTIEGTGEKYPLAVTQVHHAIDYQGGTSKDWEREELAKRRHEIIRSGTIGEFVSDPHFAQREADHDRRMNLLHGWDYNSHAWGMAIDTSSCLGCGGCIIACNVENNIPVVGKEQVRRGREMHWLRIDRYYEGSTENPVTFHMPVLCQHCENAPCEPVCPVEATTHSTEGINEMTYNRCIGTRYCSNNCPYKVRRFNFFEYNDWKTPSYKLMRNPDVTTRSRGVMEKCTFCVQRVNEARITAEREGRRVRDGEVTTACAAACPTEAIVFGDINDKNSRVTKDKSEPHNYKLLGDINTQPRVTYLATIRNPNPEIEAV